jgi:hypothetical protein
LESDAAGDRPVGGGSGGGIETSGRSLTSVDSAIAANTAGTGSNDVGSGLSVSGAGSTGGGIDASGGSVEITGSTIRENQVGNGGFGVFIGGMAGNRGGVYSPARSLRRSQTRRSRATRPGIRGCLCRAGSSSDGGAIVQHGGSVAMAQVTIAGNSKDDAFGGCHNVSGTSRLTVADSAPPRAVQVWRTTLTACR